MLGVTVTDAGGLGGGVQAGGGGLAVGLGGGLAVGLGGGLAVGLGGGLAVGLGGGLAVGLGGGLAVGLGGGLAVGLDVGAAVCSINPEGRGVPLASCPRTEKVYSLSALSACDGNWQVCTGPVSSFACERRRDDVLRVHGHSVSGSPGDRATPVRLKGGLPFVGSVTSSVAVVSPLAYVTACILGAISPKFVDGNAPHTTGINDPPSTCAFPSLRDEGKSTFCFVLDPLKPPIDLMRSRSLIKSSLLGPWMCVLHTGLLLYSPRSFKEPKL